MSSRLLKKSGLSRWEEDLPLSRRGQPSLAAPADLAGAGAWARGAHALVAHAAAGSSFAMRTRL